ncbi:MAG: HlyD family efflux transporter periplasmic adaptor subunit [Rhizobiaceae bacterium]|nr:HlyD family efflux transporter periplasmic adaptor subunit [Rhizobiaceae bacterium]
MSFFCSLPILASLISCGPGAPLAVGYVEGEFVLMAPIETAQVDTVAVRRGDRVEPGQIIVRLEDADARIAVSQAKAALAQAQAQLADLKLGKRPEEIDVLAATLASAEAEHEEAGRVVERTQDLFGRGTATQAQLDTAKTQLQVTAAAIGQAKANLAVAKLPARIETIKAAEQAVNQASAALDEAQWRLSKRNLVALNPGRVDDVIRDPGDIAGPSAPVLSLLPDGAVKLKVYVPEPDFSKLKPGGKLKVRCDGCREGLTATVSYVSHDPEFTPPVIYSLETRQKLVYLIEARPDGDTMLKPGQIVDVDLADAE